MVRIARGWGLCENITREKARFEGKAGRGWLSAERAKLGNKGPLIGSWTCVLREFS